MNKSHGMHPQRQKQSLHFAWRTDVGMQSRHNEDTILVDEGRGVMLLADGMGGHRCGAVASSLAVQEAHRFIRTSIDQTEHKYMPALLEGAMHSAHGHVRHHRSSHKDLGDMGTTLLAVAVRQGWAFLCNVGDSRAYVMSRSFRRITNDHAVEDRFVADILMTDEPYNRRCYRVLTQAIGASTSIRPDNFTLPVRRGDIILLCTDGLTDMLSDSTIETIVTSHRSDLNEIAHRLVSRANRQGGYDNISVTLLKVVT